MTNALDISFKIAPHNTPDGYSVGQFVELGGSLVSGRRTFNMGFGGWIATFCFPENNQEMRKLFEVNIREGDWVEYTIENQHAQSFTLKGFVSLCHKVKSYDAKTRAPTLVYTLQGTGWARALATPVLIGTAMRSDSTTPAVPLLSDSGTPMKDKTGTPQIPGIITVDRWADVIMAIFKGAYTGSGLADALKSLVKTLMNDTWKNPQGQSLVDLLSWKRFGSPPVRGMAWRLKDVLGVGATLTPDTLLRQASCEAYNEVFYDYDDSGKPAIVFRPRYKASYRKASEFAKVPVEALAMYDSTQSGAERFNYWRSSWALQQSGGIEYAIDQANGQSPIIDRESVERYGLRVAMPQNDLLPPLNSNTNLLKYHIGKIHEFRGWYYSNPDFITGSVKLNGIYPGSYRLGKYVEIPESQWFKHRDASGNINANSIVEPSVVGYIVGVDESFSIDSKRALTGSTSITFVRGDSKLNAVPDVPDAIPWLNTAAVAVATQAQAAPAQPAQAASPTDQPSEHITWDMLKCHNGTPVPQNLRGNAIKLCAEVEKIMKLLNNYNIKVVSGYRTDFYNRNMKNSDGTPNPGAKDSQHLYAKALDFRLAGVQPADLDDLIYTLMTNGTIKKGGHGKYSTFVHYDIRGKIVDVVKKRKTKDQ